MRKFKIVISVTLLILLGLVAGLMAREPEGFVPRPLAKTSINQTNRTMSNISNWGYWMYASGKSAGQPNGNSGGIYPRGTAGAIYLDGLVWAGKFDGDDSDIRLGGVTYSVGTVAGWINDDGTAASPSDPRVKIWRIRADYATLTYDMVRQDAMELNELASTSDVTDAMCQAVIDQYKEDWENWPSDLGAPVYDDGTPGIANADQVIWYVTNDLDNTACMSLGGSAPMGIENQVTAWAYAQTDSRLGQVIFKKYKFINKSGKNITDMFVSQWCDPDLGYYGNDYVGCDTSLSLGFAYNGVEVDDDYASFGLAPAAVGYDFFQGPIADGIAGEDKNRNGIDDAQDYAVWDLKKVGPGKINLPMSSFGWFATGSDVSDPTLGEYEGTLQWYNLMRGYLPNDNIDDPTPWTLGNITGNPTTKYPMAGDPVTGEGYIDGKDSYFDPGDRRMCLTAGPFDFVAGEVQEVVVAVIGGLGGNRLSSIANLKGTDYIAQQIYNNGFQAIPKPPAAPNVAVSEYETSIMLSWSDKNGIAVTEGPQSLNYEFEGYNVYQLPTASSSFDQAKKIATFDVINQVTNIQGVRLVPGVGEVTKIIQAGGDVGLQRYFQVEKDYITGNSLYQGKTYYFAVTAYNQDVTLPVDRALESPMVILSVTPQSAKPGELSGYEESNVSEPTVHVGTAGGSVSAEILDPGLATGHDYQVFFDSQNYYRDKDGLWKFWNDGVSKSLAKTTDVSGSVITGAGIYSPILGEVNLVLNMAYNSSTGSWIDGVELTLPAGMSPKSAVLIDGAYSNYLDYGQVDLNPAGVIDGNKISWGDSLRSTIGAIEGNLTFSLVLDAAEVESNLPLSIGYNVWDDAYDAASIIDAVGSVEISEVGYDHKVIKHWNLLDVTTNEVKVEDQTLMAGTYLERIINGVYYTGGTDAGLESVTVDGIKLDVNVSYAAPADFTGVDQTFADGSTKYRPMFHMNYFYDNGLITAIPYMIDSYMQHGWSGGEGTARSIDAYGFGTTEVSLLQRDYELRYTGEYDDAVGTYHPIKDGTGSLAILYGARGYDLATHPDANNPGDGTAFFVRIPFEVWDMEADGGPQQVTMLIYDRMGDTAAADFYAFNPNDRMYCDFLLEPYADVIAADPNSFLESDKLTWNIIFWNMQWTTGDVLHFIYDNPIVLGGDTWSFSTVAPTTGDEDLAKEAVKNINVYPNPYYANNALATQRFDNYVTFTHLPAKVKVRIFNLAGIQVKVLDKDNASQFLKWNLQNEAGLPVASGMYIAHIDCPALGKEKILKMAIIQKEQILEYY